MTNPLALHIASMGYLAMEGIGVSLAKLMAKALTASSISARLPPAAV